MILVGSKKDLATRWRFKAKELEEHSKNFQNKDIFKQEIKTLRDCAEQLEALKENPHEIKEERISQKQSIR